MKKIEMYLNNTDKAKPHKNVEEFIKMKIPPKKAIDLGCGAGRDTVFLLKHKWNVIAVDREDTKDRIINKLLPKEIENFEFIKEDFNELKIDTKVRLVVANYSIPFVNKEKIINLWNKIDNMIEQDGYFVGNFFGLKDEWKTNKGITVLSENDVLGLFRNFEIIKFIEKEEDSLTGLGKMKQWHTFNIIAKKR